MQLYGPENVTVTVEWAQKGGATYDVSIIPPVAPILTTTGSASRQLTISYNTKYNLSVVAITPCGNATASMALNYGESLIYN